MIRILKIKLNYIKINILEEVLAQAGCSAEKPKCISGNLTTEDDVLP